MFTKASVSIFIAFVIGLFIASIFCIYSGYKEKLQQNEDRYFELALQVKWNILTLKELEKFNYTEVEKIQNEQMESNLIILKNYGIDSNNAHKIQINEILKMAESYKEKLIKEH
jgi:hypothetical protein